MRQAHQVGWPLLPVLQSQDVREAQGQEIQGSISGGGQAILSMRDKAPGEICEGCAKPYGEVCYYIPYNSKLDEPGDAIFTLCENCEDAVIHYIQNRAQLATFECPVCHCQLQHHFGSGLYDLECNNCETVCMGGDKK